MARTTRATHRRAGSTFLLLAAVLLGSTACDLPAQDGVVEFPTMMPAMSARATTPANPGIAIDYRKSFDGTVIVDVLDDRGTTVASSRNATDRMDLPSGTYQVQVVEEGPVSSTRDSGHSSAVAVRSDSFTHIGGQITWVGCDANGCTIR